MKDVEDNDNDREEVVAGRDKYGNNVRRRHNTYDNHIV